MAQKRIKTYGTIRPQSIGPSAAEVKLEALGNIASKASNVAFEMGARKRTQEGKIAGLISGQKATEGGELVEESAFPSIYDQSFQKSQQAAYLAGVDRQALERLSQIESENESDPEAYAEIAEGLLKGTIEDAPSEFKPILTESINGYISNGKIRVNNNFLERSKKEAKSSLSAAVDSYSREASRAARNGDFDLLDDLMSKADLSAKAMVDGGFWTKEQADQVITSNRKEIFRQEHKRDILEVAKEDPAKAVGMLADLEKEVPETYTPDEWERVVDDIRTDLNRLMPKSKGGTKKEANDWLKNAKKSLTYGFKISDADKAEGARLLVGSDKQEEYERLLKVEQFSLLSSKQRKSILINLTEANTLDSQQDYMQLQMAHDKLNKMAEDDGMTLAKRQGRLEPAPFDDTEARAEQAEELSKLYGVTVGPYMEPEIDELVAKLPEMTPAEKTSLAMGLGPNEATYSQLDKKNASMFAMVSARQDPDLANAVFLGEEMIKTKQFQLPSREKYSDVVEEYLGGVGEVYGVEDRATVIKAAFNHYAATGDQVFAEDMLKKSLEAVTGGIGRINGSKVELPQDITEDELEDFMDDLQPEILEDLGGLMHPFPIEDVRDAQLVSIGTNAYGLSIDGMPQYGRDGEPFVMEITPEVIFKNKGYKPKRRSVREIRGR